MEELTFDLEKIKKVKMSEVHPNTWNPKKKNHEKVNDIETSIKKHGFKQPLQVRTHPTIAGEYEIIDGEQRWTAMDNLGAEYIYIYDNGKVADEDAQNETLWWQVQVPFERIDLAKLVTELDSMEMELPYTEKEILEFKGIVDGNGEDEEKKKEDKANSRINIKLSPEQYEIVVRALDMVKEQNECEDARALELICADFLSGVGMD